MRGAAGWGAQRSDSLQRSGGEPPFCSSHACLHTAFAAIPGRYIPSPKGPSGIFPTVRLPVGADPTVFHAKGIFEPFHQALRNIIVLHNFFCVSMCYNRATPPPPPLVLAHHIVSTSNCAISSLNASGR